MTISKINTALNSKFYFISNQQKCKQSMPDSATNLQNKRNTTFSTISSDIALSEFINSKQIDFGRKHFISNPKQSINNKLKKVQKLEEKLSKIAIDSSEIKRQRGGLYVTHDGKLYNGYTVSVKMRDEGGIQKTYYKYKNGLPKNQLLVSFDKKGKLNEFWLATSRNNKSRAVNEHYNLHMTEWDKDRKMILNSVTIDAEPKIKIGEIVNLNNDLLEALGYSIKY